MTTSWSLHLTRHESGQDRESTLAQTITEEPEVMAATLRALADRLDPPKPVHRLDPHGQNVIYRPRGPIDFDAPELRGSVVRTAPEHREHPARRLRTALTDSPGLVSGRVEQLTVTTGNAHDAKCQGNACSEGHTYTAGCLLAGPEPRAEVVSFAQSIMSGPHGSFSCQMGGQPHAGTCDDPQPLGEPGREDGPEHTYTGSCALRQPGADR